MSLLNLQQSYLAQVRCFRVLAEKAISLYPIDVRDLVFINHGENTTFRVAAKNGKQYLLRIHRDGYHTKTAIEEELSWLSSLSSVTGLTVPNPVYSKKKKFIESVGTEKINPRFCCVFEWVPGNFVKASLSPQHMYELGRGIALLQKHAKATTIRHYWDAEGLVGKKPKFGSFDNLTNVNSSDQKKITTARVAVLKKLKAFEKRFPKRQGLIHADLHFGNLIWQKNRFGFIDFDDSGFGFHMYDLAVPLVAMEYILRKKRKNEMPALRAALIDGYSEIQNFDSHDEKILPALIFARRLTLLGWLNSRSDNPRLRGYLKGAVARVLLEIKG